MLITYIGQTVRVTSSAGLDTSPILCLAGYNCVWIYENKVWTARVGYNWTLICDYGHSGQCGVTLDRWYGVTLVKYTNFDLDFGMWLWTQWALWANIGQTMWADIGEIHQLWLGLWHVTVDTVGSVGWHWTDNMGWHWWNTQILTWTLICDYGHSGQCGLTLDRWYGVTLVKCTNFDFAMWLWTLWADIRSQVRSAWHFDLGFAVWLWTQWAVWADIGLTIRGDIGEIHQFWLGLWHVTMETVGWH